MKQRSPENLSLPRPQIQSESLPKGGAWDPRGDFQTKSRRLMEGRASALAGVPCSLEGVVPWWVSPLEPTPGNDNLHEMRQTEASSSYQVDDGRAEELYVEHASGSE